MVAKSIFKSGTLTALAAVLAVAAFSAPAQASPNERDWQRGGRHEGERGDIQRNAAPQGGNVSTQQSPPAVQQQRDWAQQRQQSQPSRIDMPRSGSSEPGVNNNARWGDRQSGGNWQARGDQRAAGQWRGNDRSQEIARPGVPPVSQPERTRPAWSGRNTSYNDPTRNSTYSNTPDSRNGEDRRHWDRDNDKNRNSDRRNDNWRNNDRRIEHSRNEDWRNNGWQQNRESWRNNRNWNNRDHQRWDNSSWRRDNRYDWRRWRDDHHETFRGGYYNAPYRGYSYSRLSIGFFLGAPFFGQNYWITDPWAYRLPPAYAGYRWVRYYDDVVLVDTYSGEVVDVIYDFFW